MANIFDPTYLETLSDDEFDSLVSSYSNQEKPSTPFKPIKGLLDVPEQTKPVSSGKEWLKSAGRTGMNVIDFWSKLGAGGAEVVGGALGIAPAENPVYKYMMDSHNEIEAINKGYTPDQEADIQSGRLKPMEGTLARNPEWEKTHGGQRFAQNIIEGGVPFAINAPALTVGAGTLGVPATAAMFAAGALPELATDTQKNMLKEPTDLLGIESAKKAVPGALVGGAMFGAMHKVLGGLKGEANYLKDSAGKIMVDEAGKPILESYTKGALSKVPFIKGIYNTGEGISAGAPTGVINRFARGLTADAPYLALQGEAVEAARLVGGSIDEHEYKRQSLIGNAIDISRPLGERLSAIGESLASSALTGGIFGLMGTNEELTIRKNEQIKKAVDDILAKQTEKTSAANIVTDNKQAISIVPTAETLETTTIKQEAAKQAHIETETLQQTEPIIEQHQKDVSVDITQKLAEANAEQTQTQNMPPDPHISFSEGLKQKGTVTPVSKTEMPVATKFGGHSIETPEHAIALGYKVSDSKSGKLVNASSPDAKHVVTFYKTSGEIQKEKISDPQIISNLLRKPVENGSQLTIDNGKVTSAIIKANGLESNLGKRTDIRKQNLANVPWGTNKNTPDGKYVPDIFKASKPAQGIAKPAQVHPLVAGGKYKGIPIVNNPELTRKSGEAIHASLRPNDKGQSEIHWNEETAQQKFRDKAWTKPQVEGVEPLSRDQFKTYNEFVKFSLEHEAVHKSNNRDITNNETVEQYENRINKIALEKVAQDKATIEHPVIQNAVKASVKMMITKTERQRLYDLGHSKEQVDKMKPADATKILGERGSIQVAPEYMVNAVKKIYSIAKDLGHFTKELVTRFGKGIIQHAKKLYDWAKEKLKEEKGLIGKDITPNPAILRPEGFNKGTSKKFPVNTNKQILNSIAQTKKDLRLAKADLEQLDKNGIDKGSDEYVSQMKIIHNLSNDLINKREIFKDPDIQNKKKSFEEYKGNKALDTFIPESDVMQPPREITGVHKPEIDVDRPSYDVTEIIGGEIPEEFIEQHYPETYEQRNEARVVSVDSLAEFYSERGEDEIATQLMELSSNMEAENVKPTKVSQESIDHIAKKVAKELGHDNKEIGEDQVQYIINGVIYGNAKSVPMWFMERHTKQISVQFNRRIIAEGLPLDSETGNLSGLYAKENVFSPERQVTKEDKELATVELSNYIKEQEVISKNNESKERNKSVDELWNELEDVATNKDVENINKIIPLITSGEIRIDNNMIFAANIFRLKLEESKRLKAEGKDGIITPEKIEEFEAQTKAEMLENREAMFDNAVAYQIRNITGLGFTEVKSLMRKMSDINTSISALLERNLSKREIPLMDELDGMLHRPNTDPYTGLVFNTKEFVTQRQEDVKINLFGKKEMTTKEAELITKNIIKKEEERLGRSLTWQEKRALSYESRERRIGDTKGDKPLRKYLVEPNIGDVNVGKTGDEWLTFVSFNADHIAQDLLSKGLLTTEQVMKINTKSKDFAKEVLDALGTTYPEQLQNIARRAILGDAVSKEYFKNIFSSLEKQQILDMFSKVELQEAKRLNKSISSEKELYNTYLALGKDKATFAKYIADTVDRLNDLINAPSKVITLREQRIRQALPEGTVRGEVTRHTPFYTYIGQEYTYKSYEERLKQFMDEVEDKQKTTDASIAQQFGLIPNKEMVFKEKEFETTDEATIAAHFDQKLIDQGGNLTGTYTRIGKLHRIAQILLDKIANAFGAKVMVVDSNNEHIKNGAYIPSEFEGGNLSKPHIVINVAKGGFSIAKTFAHELFHHFVNKLAPEAYNAFSGALYKTYSKMDYELRDKVWGKDASKDHEVHAEIFSDLIKNPEFWKELRRVNPDLVVKMFSHIGERLAAISKVVDKHFKTNSSVFESDAIVGNLHDTTKLFSDIISHVYKEAQSDSKFESQKNISHLEAPKTKEKIEWFKQKAKGGVSSFEKTGGFAKDVVKIGSAIGEGTGKIFKQAQDIFSKYFDSSAGALDASKYYMYRISNEHAIETERVRNTYKKYVDSFRGMTHEERVQIQDALRRNEYDTLPDTAKEFFKTIEPEIKSLYAELKKRIPDLPELRSHFGQSLKWFGETTGIPMLSHLQNMGYSELEGTKRWEKSRGQLGFEVKYKVEGKDVTKEFKTKKEAEQEIAKLSSKKIEAELKAQSIQDMIDAGRKPETLDPFQTFINYVEDTNRFINLHDILEEMRQKNDAIFSKDGKTDLSGNKLPEGYTFASDNVFKLLNQAALDNTYRIKLSSAESEAPKYYSNKVGDIEKHQIFTTKDAAEIYKKNMGIEGEVTKAKSQFEYKNESGYSVYKITKKMIKGKEEEQKTLMATAKDAEEAKRFEERFSSETPDTEFRSEPNLTDLNLNPEMARMYFSPDFVRMLDTYLGRDNIRNGDIGRTAADLKNFWTRLELSLSMFHAGTMLMESTAAYAATSQQVNGFGNIYKIPFANIKGMIDANKELNRLWDECTINPEASKDPVVQAKIKQLLGTDTNFTEMVDLLRIAGAITGQDPTLRHGSEYRFNYHDEKGNLSIKTMWKNVETDFTRYQKEGADQYIIPSLKTGFDTITKGTTDWLFESVIPQIKKAQALRNLAIELEKNPNMTKQEKTMLAIKVQRQIENQFGEMNWANLWMNKTLAGVLKLGFRSFTWILGTYKMLGTSLTELVGKNGIALLEKAQGNKDAKFEITPMGYWALNAVAAHVFASMLISTLSGSIFNKDDKDINLVYQMMYPGIDPKDAARRVSISSYPNEFSKTLIHIMNGDFSKLFTGRLNGIIGKGIDLARNHDFADRYIVDPRDSILGKTYDIMAHMMPLPMPISGGMSEYRQGTLTPATAFIKLLGVQPAIMEGTKSAATKHAIELGRKNFEGKMIHHEEAEHKDELAHVRSELRKGNMEPYNQLMRSGNVSKQVLKNQIKKIEYLGEKKNSMFVPEILQRANPLPWEDFVETYRMATPREQSLLKPLVFKKYASTLSKSSRTREEKIKMKTQFDELRKI